MSAPRPTPPPRQNSLTAALHQSEEELFGPILRNLEEIKGMGRDGGRLQLITDGVLEQLEDVRIQKSRSEDLFAQAAGASLLLGSEIRVQKDEVTRLEERLRLMEVEKKRVEMVNRIVREEVDKLSRNVRSMSSPPPIPLPRLHSLGASRANVYRAEEEQFEPLIENLEEIERSACKDGGRIQSLMRSVIDRVKDLRVQIRNSVGSMETVVKHATNRSSLLTEEVRKVKEECRFLEEENQMMIGELERQDMTIQEINEQLRQKDVDIEILNDNMKSPLAYRPGPSNSGPIPNAEKVGDKGTAQKETVKKTKAKKAKK